jgi:hypothetical protein
MRRSRDRCEYPCIQIMTFSSTRPFRSSSEDISYASIYAFQERLRSSGKCAACAMVVSMLDGGAQFATINNMACSVYVVVRIVFTMERRSLQRVVTVSTCQRYWSQTTPNVSSSHQWSVHTIVDPRRMSGGLRSPTQSASTCPERIMPRDVWFLERMELCIACGSTMLIRLETNLDSTPHRLIIYSSPATRKPLSLAILHKESLP